MNPLFVGIDVSSKNNVAYLMKPDGGKHSSFSVQNNPGGAKLYSIKSRYGSSKKPIQTCRRTISWTLS